jgi:putative hydrolase of the HAD superfamily
MAGEAIRAVFLDALGTLVALEPPAPRLRAGLAAHGVEVSEREAGLAVRAEISFYRANLLRGRDAAGLAALRAECAAVTAAALPPAARVLGAAVLEQVLIDALEFTPFADTVPALEALRARGLTLVVVSNWDVSLHEMLDRTGLRPLVDGAIASAELGVAKPDPAPFEAALALAGVAPAEAWHAGDDVAADVDGAAALGITPVLVDRDGELTAPDGVAVVSDLGELVARLG